ncbi:MAG TPA: hypothetical protein VE778_05095 [Candidatus Bathyarchaeia archaeon]|jgi:tetratricopeptide (TPR) repeat protein|nr:hypothetical protein [Candidatus Bathyarchaeia archaeon]
MLARILLLSAAVLFLPNHYAVASSHGQTSSQNKKAPSYSVAEYNEYMTAAQLKNPEQRLGALDRFVAMYPHSALLPFAYETYYSTYAEMKKHTKTIEYADKFLTLQSNAKPTAQLRALAARTRAFELSSADGDSIDQARFQRARDHAIEAITLLGKIPKPENVSATQFEQEKRTARAFYEYAVGYADLGLKDYGSAVQHLQFAASVNADDPLIFYQLGIADLGMNPPSYLDGFWALARSVALNGPNATQAKAYLRNQLLRYQQCACQDLIEDQITALIAKAGTQPIRPAALDIPSAEELQKVRESTGPILDELRTNSEHAQKVWLADCGLEFPEVAVKILSVSKEGDVVVLKSFRGPTIEEMRRVTEPNMEIRVSGQPDVERLKTGDWVRFHGTLTALQRDPFLLRWEKAQINPQDIPAEVVKKPRKRMTRKQKN